MVGIIIMIIIGINKEAAMEEVVEVEETVTEVVIENETMGIRAVVAVRVAAVVQGHDLVLRPESIGKVQIGMNRRRNGEEVVEVVEGEVERMMIIMIGTVTSRPRRRIAGGIERSERKRREIGRKNDNGCFDCNDPRVQNV